MLKKGKLKHPLVCLFLYLLAVPLFLLSLTVPSFATCNLIGNNYLSPAEMAKSEKVRLKKIYDGDTLLLTDGRKVRLIGINTPELARKGKPSQPYAKKAKQKLKSLLSSSSILYLVYDKDKKDKYKRTLAYVYNADGLDIQAQMLLSGFAISIVVAANDKNLNCYRKLEKQARNKYVGIWKQKSLRAISAKKLAGKVKGFYFVNGKVSSIKTRSHSLIIKLNNTLSVKITSKAFTAYRHQHLLGKNLHLRVWVYFYYGKPRATIAYPSDLSIID